MVEHTASTLDKLSDVDRRYLRSLLAGIHRPQQSSLKRRLLCTKSAKGTSVFAFLMEELRAEVF